MRFAFDIDRLAEIAARGRDAYARAAPFPHAVIDGLLRDDAADALAAALPGPDDDAGWDRYAAEGFEMKLASADQARLPEAVVRVLHEFNSGPFIAFVEALTGIPHLGVHADFNWHPAMQAHRRVNLLLYLNPGWNAAWGGDLELWSTDAARREASIAPVHNRAVVFATRSDTFHGHPAPLATPPGVWRRSIAMYYYTTTRPDDETRAPHGTRYKGLHLE